MPEDLIETSSHTLETNFGMHKLMQYLGDRFVWLLSIHQSFSVKCFCKEDAVHHKNCEAVFTALNWWIYSYLWWPKQIGLIYCKVWNINVEVIKATWTSGSNSLILRSVSICFILYSNCVYSHNHTCQLITIRSYILWYINVSRSTTKFEWCTLSQWTWVP